MFQKTIREICTMLDVKNDLSAFDSVVVKGVSIDTRKIEDGNLFVPFKGENVDGHQFARQAIENGASAALWDMNVPNPPEDIPVIVVEDPLLALRALTQVRWPLSWKSGSHYRHR